MASTYSPNLRLELIGTGEQQGTWGSTTNTNLGTLLEEAIGGYVSVTVSDVADTTLTSANGAADESRNAVINLTGTLTGARNVICPAIEKLYVVKNATSGGYAVTFKVSGQTGVSVPSGATVSVYVDGTDARTITGSLASQYANNVAITGGTISGAAITNGTMSGTSISSASISNTSISSSNATITGGTITGVTNVESTNFNVGNASDTTITRVSAGVIAVEGNQVPSPGSVAQGDVLYYNGTNWARLGAGTANQVLITNGPSANPSWGTVPSSAVVTVYTSGSGTWTIPSTGTAVLVRAWGGGGSGGRDNAAGAFAGFGGGGGGYAERLYQISSLGNAGSTISYSVAAGGAAAVTNGSGNAGGNSTFSSGANLLTAYGGGGGKTNLIGGGGGGVLSAGTTDNSNNGGAMGGGSGGSRGVTGTAASIPWGGGGGGGGDNDTSAGSGGATFLGGGGGGGGTSAASGAGSGGSSVAGGSGGNGGTNTNGTAGSAPGGGGGGSCGPSVTASGAGANGRIEIWVW